ncbi:MAG: FG-GAP repeat domain-containing protein [bacterium]
MHLTKIFEFNRSVASITFSVMIVLLMGNTFPCFGDGPTAWLENDGTDLGFTENIIQEGTPGDRTQYADVTDFDSDGDSDVATAGGDTIAWFENNGDTNFTKHVVSSGGTTSNAEKVEIVDFDEDSDSDLVVVTDGAFLWYENDGSNTNFTEQVIDASSSATNGIDIHATKFDGDGDIDVVTATLLSDTISWYENDGSDVNFTQHTIDSGGSASFTEIEPVDFDDDGDTEVVSAGLLSGFRWYDNDGGDTVFTTRVIAGSNETGSARDIEPVDFNQDGNMDVVTADLGDTFAWFENSGTDTSFTSHIIDSGNGALQAVDIHASDFDKDGDVDAVTAAKESDEVSWYENDGTDTGFRRNLIDTGASADSALDVDPVNFNNDGHMDVVTVSIGTTNTSSENSPNQNNGGTANGGCVIGKLTPDRGTVNSLRSIRDDIMNYTIGRAITKWYYWISKNLLTYTRL